MKFEILFDIQSTGDGKYAAQVAGLKEVQGAAAGASSALGGIGSAGSAATGGVDAISGAIKSAAIQLLALAGAAKALEAIKNAVTDGLAFNSMLQQQQLSIAATYATFTKMTDARGKDLDSLQRYAASQSIAIDLQDKLRTAALKTTLQYSELATAMTTSMPSILQNLHTQQGKTISNQQMVDFIAAFSQGAKSFGLDPSEIPQNIRKALQGDATQRTAKFSAALESDLGSTTAQRKAAVQQMAEEGKLLDYLMGRLQAYGQAGKDAMNTYAGALSNLKDAWQQLTGEGVHGAGGKLTTTMLELRDALVQVDSKGKLTFNENLVSSIRSVADAVAGITLAGIHLVEEFTKPDGVLFTLKSFTIETAASLERAQKPPTPVIIGGHSLAEWGAYLSGQGTGATNVSSFGEMWTKPMTFGSVPNYPGHQVPVEDAYAALGAKIANLMTPTRPSAGNYLFPQGTMPLKGQPFAGYGKPIGPDYDKNIRPSVVTSEDNSKAIHAAQELEKLRDHELATLIEIGAKSNDRLSTTSAQYAASMKVTDAEKATADQIVKTISIDNQRRQELERIAKSEADALAQVKLMEVKKGGVTQAEKDQAKAAIERQAASAAEAVNITANAEKTIALTKEQDDIYSKQLAAREAIGKLVETNTLAAKTEYDLGEATAKQDLAKQLIAQAITAEQQKQAGLMQIQADADMRRLQMAQQLAELDRKHAADIVELNAKFGLTSQGLNPDGTQNETANAQRDALDAADKEKRRTLALKAARDLSDDEIKTKAVTLARIRQMYDEMYGAVSSTANRLFNDIAQGRGLSDGIKGLASDLTSILGKNLTQPLDDWFKKLALDASGMPQKDANGNLVYPSDSTQTHAKAGYAAIAGAAGAFELFSGANNRTRTQNVEMGVGTGASIGSAFSGYGAVIGAIVGLIAGLAAPSAKANEYYVNLQHGTGSVKTGGGAHDWQGLAAQRTLNTAIENSRAQAQGIIDAFPQHVFDQLGNVDLNSAISGGFTFRYSGSDQALANFTSTTIPQMILDAALPAVQAGFQKMGVGDKRWEAIKKYATDADPAKGMAFLASYATATSSLADSKSFFGLGSDTQLANARKDASGLGQLGKANDDIARLAKGFDQLTLPEQVTRAQQIADKITSARQIELQMLDQIDQAQKSVTESIRQQQFSIALDQARLPDGSADPNAQIGMYLADERRLRGLIEHATSADQIAGLVSQIQADVNAVYGLQGKTPDAAKQAQDILADLGLLSNNKFAEFQAQVKDQNDKMLAATNGILDQLKNGIIVSFAGPNDSDPNAPTPGGDDPPKRGKIIKALSDSSDSFNTSTLSFGGSVDNFARVIGAMSTSWTGNVNVTIPAPIVQVHIEGDAASVITRVTAQVIPAATQHVMSALAQSQSRGQIL